MADVIISPNMSLPVPVPGVDPGPDWADNLNSSLNIIDGHNHSPGSGVQVTPLGLDINTDLPMQNHDLTQTAGIQFSAPASSALLTRLYTNSQAGGGIVDLFYNDGAGNVIPLTKGGAVNATIANLPGESFAGGTFTWKQGDGSTTPANFDIGSINIRPNIAGTTFGVRLNPPSGISSQYDLDLPEIPASEGFVTLDSSGNFGVAQLPVPPSGSPGFVRIDNAGSLTAVPIYDIVVGSGGDFSTIGAAITAASAGQSIYVLRGTYSENVVINKQLNIYGAGRGTVIAGSVEFATGSSDSLMQGFKANGITIDAGVQEIQVENFWNASGFLVADNGVERSNYIQGMQE